MEDPDIFHADAKFIFASAAQDVLLYIKNNKLYQISPCCGLLCCCNSSSQRLSKIRDIEVVTGTVKVLYHVGTRVVKVHRINLGLKIRVSHWFGDGVRIYDTPDAVELARRLNPNLLGRATIIPTRIDMTIRQPAPSSGGGGGGACGGGGGGGCH